MMRLPNTVPIPAPEPATPTVAAPAPMNLAAVSMSRETALVWKERVRTADWLTGNRACGGGGISISVHIKHSSSAATVLNSFYKLTRHYSDSRVSLCWRGALKVLTCCSTVASGLLKRETDTGRASILDPPRSCNECTQNVHVRQQLINGGQHGQENNSACPFVFPNVTKGDS